MNRLLSYETQFNEKATLEEKHQFVKQLTNQAEFEFALKFYLQLKDLYLAAEQHENVMACLSGICQNLGNLGRVLEIEHYLSEYKIYCHQYGDKLAKFKLYSFIGYMSASIEDFKSAEENYEMAISIASELEDLTRSTYVLINLQNVYLETDKFEEALRCSLQLNQIFKEDRNAFSKLSYCAYLLNYMTLLLEVNELEKFPFKMEELENVEGYYKLKREQMYAAFLNGLYNEKLGNLERAANYLEVAYEYLEYTKEAPHYKRILKHLIRIFKQCKQFEKSQHYADILIEHLESTERKKIQIKTIELSSELKLHDMQELIYFDSLTNIHNRRYLEIQGENWTKYAVANDEKLVCAIFDIDDFKKINDQYGHVIGDEVLQHISKQLRNHVEEDMICTRYGGDEFVILARAKENYYEVFTKLFEKLTSTIYIHKNHVIQTTISMGVSELNNAVEKTLKDLINAADCELYKTKHSGKNGITFNLISN